MMDVLGKGFVCALLHLEGWLKTSESTSGPGDGWVGWLVSDVGVSGHDGVFGVIGVFVILGCFFLRPAYPFSRVRGLGLQLRLPGKGRIPKRSDLIGSSHNFAYP